MCVPMTRTPEEIAALQRLGARIRARRKAKGWSVLQLATKAGISFEHIHTLERGGKHKPRDYTLRRIAKALGVSVATLLRDNGNGNGRKKNGNGNGGKRK